MCAGGLGQPKVEEQSGAHKRAGEQVLKELRAADGEQ